MSSGTKRRSNMLAERSISVPSTSLYTCRALALLSNVATA